MAKGKWIGGFIGWMAGGPLGALAGYLLGSLFDNMLDGVNNPNNSGTWQSSSYEDYNTAYQQAYRQRQMQGDRNSFLFSLLVLSSYIIKADGKQFFILSHFAEILLLSVIFFYFTYNQTLLLYIFTTKVKQNSHSLRPI